MTLAELIKHAISVGNQFSTSWIPLKLDGEDVDITFTPEGSNDTEWVINLKIEKK